jgi:hypothetical protein
MSSPAISAAAAPNEQVVISVTMLSTSRLNAPTGAVAFIDNGAPISGTPTITAIDGAGISSAGFTAKMPVTLTQAGMHTLSISYAGDGNYNPITQNIGTVDVTTTALAVALPPGASQVTLPPTGGSGSAPITLFDSMSSSMTVTLSCKPDSTAATCSVNPATVNVQPNSITTLATVSYTVPALTGRLHPALPFELPFVFAGVLAGFACSKRRKGTLAFLLLAAALAMSMASCGGGGGHNSAPNVSSNPSPRVYNFTVTAVAGSNSDSKTITVTVQ